MVFPSLRNIAIFDIPIATVGTIFGIFVGENSSVDSAKWAAISAIATVLIAKFFQYARGNRVNAVTIADIDAKREEKLLKTFSDIIHAKTDEKHDTAGVMQELLLTVYALKTGAKNIDEIDFNKLVKKAQDATKPKHVEVL